MSSRKRPPFCLDLTVLTEPIMTPFIDQYMCHQEKNIMILTRTPEWIDLFNHRGRVTHISVGEYAIII